MSGPARHSARHSPPRGAPTAQAPAALALGLVLAAAAPAEVVFDGTMGPPGMLSGDFKITDAHGTQVGANLFHSFETFNVATGESATFTSTAPGPTDHVIGRVTGGALSTIDGPLASTIADASLWLVNPNGVVFGDNASLDVAGGFHASTADYVALADGGRFDATSVDDTLLTTAAPAAFGFLGAGAGAIDAGAATLAVPAGRTLSLVGGDVSLAGTTLSAPGGRLNLASAADAGTLELAADGIGAAGLASFGQIRLEAGADVRTTGDSAGDVYIRGGRFVADAVSYVTAETHGTGAGAAGGDITLDVASAEILNGSQLSATTFGAADGGDLTLRSTGAVEIRGAAPDQTPAGLFANAREAATGNAGDLSVEAAALRIVEGGAVTSMTLGAGDTGNVSIDVAGTLLMRSTPGAFDADVLVNSQNGTGSSGALAIRADELLMEQGALIQGDNAAGPGGNLSIEAATVDLSGGSQISASTTGAAAGGAVTVDATDVTLSGFQPTQTGVSTTGIYATSGNAGDGGQITVNADTLTLREWGGIFANAFLFGDAGRIDVTARTIDIGAGSAINSSTFGFGRGGDVTVEATETLRAEGDSGLFTGVFANTFWDGDAGTLTVTAPDLHLGFGAFVQSGSFSNDATRIGRGGNVVVNADTLTVDGGFVSARTETSGDGGSLTVNATETIRLLNSSGVAYGGLPIGGLLASAGGILNSPIATGNAGDITVETGELILRDGGVITGDTFLAGDAGDLIVNADVVDIFGETSQYTGLFNSSGTEGAGGSIRVTARDFRVAGEASLTAGAFAAGPAGSILVEADTLSVTDGGRVISSTFGAGAGGRVGLTGGTISVTQGGEVTAGTTAAGRGGDIVLDGGHVEIASEGTVSASATGAGNAGTVRITAAERVDVVDGGAIETSSAASAGGNIDLTIGHMLYLDGGEISAAADGVTPEDAGGNVTIDPEFVILRDSDVLASANAGNGGNIAIQAGTFVIDTTSRINASSNTGLDGEIAIDSPHEVTGDVIPLATPATGVTAPVARRCVPRLEAERSTLVVANASGVRGAPTDYLGSPATSPASSFDAAALAAAAARGTLSLLDPCASVRP